MKPLHRPRKKYRIADVEVDSILEGFLTINIVRNGERIPVCVDQPNLLLNGAFDGFGRCMFDNNSKTFRTFTDASTNYADPGGTWSQSGNTVTRTTGTGTFAAGDVGNEILWQDGQRCHVTAFTNSTTITVSGPAQTLTGKTMRKYLTNRSSTAGSSQTKESAVSASAIDLSAGTVSQTWIATFDSATVAYSLASVMILSQARIVLAAPVSVLVDDQLEMSYTVTATIGNRTQAYDLGSEASGLPTQYTASTIVGNGTTFDIVTSIANHFVAGDQILLENFVPLRFAISSGSSNSTTITVNTTLAHGLAVSDSIVIETAAVAGYNNTWVVASVPTTTSFTITTATNPGALGASGTVRLSTPVTYFNGTFTVASKPTSSTVRVTSTIQGPAIDPKTFGSIRGVRYDIWGGTQPLGMGTANAAGIFWFNESNVKSIPPVTQTTNLASTTGGVIASSTVQTSSSYANDFTYSIQATWNAGAGTAESRIKQLYTIGANAFIAMLTFTVPQSKTTSDRLRWTYSIKNTRTLTPLP